MPNPVAVSAGIIALSMAVAAAIVVYESPEIRRRADELRRRIAVALQSMGDSISPDDLQNADREPVFNRPEDAEGFMLSRSGPGAKSGDPGVDADEESRRRQREELLYWNRFRLEKQQKEQDENQERWNPRDALDAMQRATREAATAAGIRLPASFGGGAEEQEQRPPVPPKTAFDSATGHSTHVTGRCQAGGAAEGQHNGELVRRRGWTGSVNSLNASSYANPFGDEYGIELDDQHTVGLAASTQSTPGSQETAFSSRSAYMVPDGDELLSDIYNASEPDTSAANKNKNTVCNMDALFDPLPLSAQAPMQMQSQHSGSGVLVSEVYFDAEDAVAAAAATTTPTTRTVAGSEASSLLLERHAPVDNDEILPGSHDNSQVYSSIQAWAQTSSGSAAGFYSPLPVTPALSVAMSEPEVVSTGELTPVESVSTFWGDEVVAAPVSEETTPAAETATAGLDDTASLVSAAESRDYEVMSDDSSEKSVLTPTSWSEVGSIVTESDAGMAQAGHA